MIYSRRSPMRCSDLPEQADIDAESERVVREAWAADAMSCDESERVARDVRGGLQFDKSVHQGPSAEP